MTLLSHRLKALFWWVILPLALIFYTAAWLTPATYWYQPRSIYISDAVVGSDPIVSINRTIKRNFHGRYEVSVWQEPSDGHFSCAGQDELRYKAGLFKPHESPLTQWVDDPWCKNLPEGRFYAEACWTIIRPFWFIVPDKQICATSNLFTIVSKEGISNEG